MLFWINGFNFRRFLFRHNFLIFMKLYRILILFYLTIITTISHAAAPNKIRIGMLAFGTLAWELSTVNQQPNLAHSITLETQTFATPQAAEIALQADAVDVILADWFWTAQMRNQQHEYQFYPYSTTSGALVVPANSPIHQLSDLKGKRLGIAGGELDKNWRLLQALMKQQHLDLATNSTPVFAAPPLLNQQLLQGNIDAVLNYWHYAARLEIQGYKTLINGQQIIQQLGFKTAIPSLGYVFKQSWAEKHPKLLIEFFKITQQAKQLLCESDSAWQAILPLTQTPEIALQNRLRQRYCDGRIQQWGQEQQQAAAQLYRLIAQDKAAVLPVGTFWNAE